MEMMVCLDGSCNPLWKALAMVAIGLIFGLGYDAVVSWLERSGHDQGYTAFLVVGGVSVTLLLGMALIGQGAALWMFVMFAATGLFMVLGSWSRSSLKRKADEEGAKRIAREALDDQAVNERVRNADGNQPGQAGK